MESRGILWLRKESYGLSCHGAPAGCEHDYDSCGGPADTKKDAAQSGKQIEITERNGSKGYLEKTSPERVVSSIECFWWCVLDYGCVARQKM